MDLNTISAITPARTRADLARLDSRVVPLAGGTVLFADPNVELRELVDLNGLGWAPLTVTGDGLEIAATCTLAELSRIGPAQGGSAHPLFFQCCTALFGSFKIWNVATVGGNLCASLPAGPMTSLTAALDGIALIWRRDGSDERMPVAEFITGNTTNALEPGDVLRSILLPAYTLAAQTAFRKIALSPLGRSGSVVIGRRDPDGAFTLTVTAATVRPVQLRYPTMPTAAALERDALAIDAWFTDAHGAADWRRAVSAVLAEEIRVELSGGSAS